ncbi:hypothetical protein MTO96_004157 [Rhipicephalus appendiculatus]
MEAKFVLLLWTFGGIVLPCLTSENDVEPAPGSEDCCGRCLSKYCEEGGKLYQVGETWLSNVRPCFEVQCVAVDRGAVEMKYARKRCPPLPPNCPRNIIVRDETGCCRKCKFTPGEMSFLFAMRKLNRGLLR